ncbi:transporter substrate-binding domain-containing protein [Xenophilus arseniciresistens]|uniref:Transporter substrate-binding domain-containing protein n=1 Tax=Xenophilus arseniciresistens TaxID=1283306 RepID=A0AAE3T245_9BURK|nr:transporter substrate-binding domain-containing protein [Xenophilus arseniciresistens]MDA7418671.1 transporter substrate-binding domain-containing protein [Xenophilus arseniciresistens]
MQRRQIFNHVAAAGVVAATTTAAITTPAQAQGTAGAASGSTLDKVQKSGVLRVAVIPGQEPYFHKDLASGQWSGACLEMAGDIAGILRAKVEPVESSWGNQILDLQSGKVDLAFAVSPTPQRALVIDFSSPLLVHSYTVIARKGFAKVDTWEQINKKEVKIAVDIGSTHETIARRYCPKATIVGFKTRDEAIMAVATGRADCNVSLAVIAISTMKKNPNVGTLNIPKPTLTMPTNLGIRIESDPRWKNFLSVWADNNRFSGQTREWMSKGFAALSIKPEDIPAEIQF